MNAALKKNFYKFFYFFPVLVFSVLSLFAQESYKTISETELHLKEKELINSGDSVLHGSSDSIRINANEKFLMVFQKLLTNQNTFSYAFDSLTSVSVLKSKDGLIKIYTWLLPACNRNKFSYYGFVQTYNKKTKQVKLFSLTEKKYNNEETLNKTLAAEEWYGALYYKLLENKIKGKTIYTLLGWHGNNNLTTRKIIDILSLKENIPVFGLPIIRTENKTVYRLIFEYTAMAVMKLNFDDQKKMIVFDSLSPAKGAEKGQYEFYGPDFRYNALHFKKGNWILLKDIDLRNPKSFDAPEGKKEKGKTLYDPDVKP